MGVVLGAVVDDEATGNTVIRGTNDDIPESYTKLCKN